MTYNGGIKYMRAGRREACRLPDAAFRANHTGARQAKKRGIVYALEAPQDLLDGGNSTLKTLQAVLKAVSMRLSVRDARTPA